jgi:hypothetical protein
VAALGVLFCVGLARGDVALWAAGDTVKIGRDEPRPAETYVWDGERVSIKAARGEWESFQVVINSDETRLVSFQVYDLEGARGKIAGANVSIYREVYLPVEWPSVDPDTNFTVGGAAGWWPDPLVPVVGHAEVAAGGNAVFWFDVWVPPEAFAGKYAGDVVFKWSGGERVLALELAVWDFALPPEGPGVIMAGLEAANVDRLYGLKPEGAEAAAMRGAYSRLLEEHRVSAVASAESGLPGDTRVMTFAEGDAYRGAVADLESEGARVGYDGGGWAGFIDRPASDHRLVGWGLWRFGGDFVWLKNVSYFPRKDPKPLSDDPRNENGNGAGALVYAGTELGYDRPLPSIRLKMLREAAEDYMYLRALAEAGYAAYADELAAAVVPTWPRPGAPGTGEAAIYDGREAAALATVKGRWGQGIAENDVRGRVVSDEGVPVAGAVVSAGPLAAVAGREGEYELRYAPRGRSLTAEAPGYERAGASSAGGRGDFHLKQTLRRAVWNDGGGPPEYAAKGYDGGDVALEGNVVGGPAFVGRLKANRAGRLAFRPALQDWRTFGAFVVELYNGSEGRVRAGVRFEDAGGAFYEEVFFLPPRGWLPARVDVRAAGERYYLEAAGSGDGLKFKTEPKLDFSFVKEVEIFFEGEAGAEVRVGRTWLEARKE